MPVPVKDPLVPTDKLPSMVAWCRLETSSIAVNLAQMKYILLTATEQVHCVSPLCHHCDVRIPVYPMTSSKLCTVALFMKDTENLKNYCKIEVEPNSENVKNYCKTGVEPNSILPRAYHKIDGFWFIATQNTLALTVVCPQKQKETLIVNPPLGIIKLNMSCAAASSYLTLLPYYHQKSK